MPPHPSRIARAGATPSGSASAEADTAADSGVSSGGYARSWLGIFIVFNLLSLKIDSDVFDPETFVIPAALTLGVFMPLALGAIVALRGAPSRARQDVAVALVAFADMAIVLNSARIAPAEHVETYLVLAAIIPLLAGIIIPMAFRHLLGFCGASLLAYGLFVAVFLAPSTDHVGVPLLLAALILVPLKLGHAREREDRLRAELRHAERSKAEALIEANARLTRLSRTDALTGLANRRHFTERLDESWAEACRRHDWLSLILVDIDHFKRINDTAGHAAGDVTLTQVAHVLSEVVDRAGGLLARHGGEEFGVLVFGMHPEAARALGERMRRQVADLPVAHAAFPMERGVTVSVGVTTVHGHAKHLGIEIGRVLQVADEALYAAKRAGRNRVVALETHLAAPVVAETALPERGRAVAGL